MIRRWRLPGPRRRLWLATAVACMVTILAAGAAYIVTATEVLPLAVALAFLCTAAVATLAGLAWLLDRRLARPLVTLARDARNQLHTGACPARPSDQRHWLEALPRAVDDLGQAWRASETGLGRAAASWRTHGETVEARLNAVLAHINEGAVFCDGDGLIQAFNRRFREMVAQAPELGIGRPLSGLLDTTPLADLWDAASDQPVYASTSIRASGTSVGISAIATPVEGGERLLLITPWPAEGPRNRRAGRRQSIATLQRLAGRLRDGLSDSTADEIDRAAEALLDPLQETLSALADELSARHRLPAIPASRLLNQLSRHGIQPAMPVTATRSWIHADIPALTAAIDALKRHLGPLVVAIQASDDPDWAEVRLTTTGAPPSIAVANLSEIPVDGLGEPQTVMAVVRDHDGEIAPTGKGDGVVVRLPAMTIGRRSPEVPPPSRNGPRRNHRLDELDYVVFDTETTGLEPAFGDRIVAIGAQRLRGTETLPEFFETLVNPERPIPALSTHYHGITDTMVADAPTSAEALREFRAFCGNAVLVAHNAAFDMRFLHLGERAAGVRFDNAVLDTLLVSLLIDDQAREHTLEAIAARLQVPVTDRHSALGDAQTTATIFRHQIPLLLAGGFITLGDAERASQNRIEYRRQQRAF